MNGKNSPAAAKRDADPLRMIEAIDALERAGYRIYRPSEHQLKYAECNLWPGTGKINIDPGTPYPERGWEAFLALLQTKYPKKKRLDDEDTAFV